MSLRVCFEEGCVGFEILILFIIRLIASLLTHALTDLALHAGSCVSMCRTPPPGSPLVGSSCRAVKTKKIMYDLTETDDFDREMIATYEEVARMYPRQGIYRPLILIGAPGVGRNELKRRLVARDPEKYRSPVPCEGMSRV